LGAHIRDFLVEGRPRFLGVLNIERIVMAGIFYSDIFSLTTPIFLGSAKTALFAFDPSTMGAFLSIGANTIRQFRSAHTSCLGLGWPTALLRSSKKLASVVDGHILCYYFP